jgi:hypothetical protein
MIGCSIVIGTASSPLLSQVAKGPLLIFTEAYQLLWFCKMENNNITAYWSSLSFPFRTAIASKD